MVWLNICVNVTKKFRFLFKDKLMGYAVKSCSVPKVKTKTCKHQTAKVKPQAAVCSSQLNETKWSM